MLGRKLFAMPVSPSSDDLVEITVDREIADTQNRLVGAITGAGLSVFSIIDHAAAAQAVGLQMPPTRVLLYGNPRGGTPVMLQTPAAALDLPLRVLVRATPDNRTVVAFHPIVPMLTRIGAPNESADRLVPAQQLLIKALKE